MLPIPTAGKRHPEVRGISRGTIRRLIYWKTFNLLRQNHSFPEPREMLPTSA